MTWSVAAPTAEFAACRLDLDGSVSATDLTAAFEQCARVCAEHDTWLVLTDAATMTGGHTVLDVYPFVMALTAMGVQDRFREAIVFPTDQDAARNVSFWEDAAVNRGLSCAAFTTEGAAVAWLLS